MWRKNLIICWFGTLITMVGMSQVAPILPLYIKQLGVYDTALIAQFSGVAFGITFIVSAVFSPIWGLAADKYGRKPMLLRASLGMSVVMFSIAYVQNVYQLIGLRLLQGVITGYSTACITLIATQIDKDKAGWALGILSTASIAGSLFGPMLSGYIVEILGLRYVFFITGLLLMITFIATLFFIEEQFHSSNKEVLSAKEVWQALPDRGLIVTMLVTTFILAFALYTIAPIITVYITQLDHNTTHIALFSGMVFSASGLASIFAAPRLGKLSDKVGPQKIILVALIAAAIILIPQSFVKNHWQLMGLRFLLGIATGGLAPSINSLIKRITPDSLSGRVFGFNMSAGYLGVFGGSILGGQVAAYWGIRYVFFITSTLLLINAVWVYNTVYRKLTLCKDIQG